MSYFTRRTLFATVTVFGGKVTDTYRHALQAEVASLGLYRADGTHKLVGIISFKNVVEDCKQALVDIGVPADHITIGWYYNVRGANDFSSCDVLVILGYPVPNPQGLYEEVCAVYEGDLIPVVREAEYFDVPLNLRNGNSVVVEDIRGYKDRRMHALYLQKSRWELYQAFHRSRPLLKEAAGGVTDVLVFTDVPIPGVLVDRFMGREGKVLQVLTQRLGVNAVVSKAELVDGFMTIVPGESNTSGALDRWVRHHSPWLAVAAGAWYIDGKGSKSGLFIKSSANESRMEETEFDSNLDAALAYARAGLPVLPLHSPTASGGCSCRKPSCTSKGKHPRTRSGVYDASVDEATIRNWWKRRPDANVGIATGVASRLVVLDVDPRNGGDESLKKLGRDYGQLPETWQSRTGGGGSHYYFKYPTGVTAVHNRGSLGGLPGIEIKSDGLLVVAPPSTTDGQYSWHPTSRNLALADIPPWLLELVQESLLQTGVVSAIKGFTEDLESGVPLGKRDNAAVRLVGKWVAALRPIPFEDPVRLQTTKTRLEGGLLAWNALQGSRIDAGA